MASFQSDGVEIAYEVTGEGAPVLLIHGFASNARVNWRDTLWVKTLVGAGHRVIAHDNRGHGQSEKLHDPADYGADEMAEDARRLLDHLEIAQADVIGYSMGARLTALLAIAHPDRVRRAVLGGLAANMIRGLGGSETIAKALEADNAATIADPAARGFRAFAEQTNSDLRALAACMRGSRQKVSEKALAGIACPVLVVAGDADEIAGPVEPLVAAIPNARGLPLPGRDHMKAVGDRLFKQETVAFLGED
ncbi:MAG TPA: alpha/beta hydrolase [Aestuariivirgaceae bacterium]|nr:alpha/beta hydrolase [Aestuariivirgaceae bacterium]